MSSRRYPSGSEKRKRKKRADEFIETQRGAMDKFFSSNLRTSRNQNEKAIVAMEEQPDNNPEDQGFTPEENIDTNRNDNNVSDHEPIVNSPPTEIPIRMLVLMNNLFLLRIFMIKKLG
jgi:hypothetical protein